MIAGVNFVGAYDPTAFYPIGDAVAYGSTVYVAIADNTSITPPNATYWSTFASGIEFMGTYSATANYKKSDIVTYGPSAYIALQDTTAHDPTQNAYWSALVSGISPSAVWNSATNYVPGSLVAYGANLYQAVGNNTNQTPTNTTGTLNSTYWSLFTTSIRSMGEWTTASTYYINDVVSHGGNTYVCTVRHASVVFATDLAASKWTKFNSGIRARGNWATGVSYLVNDVITTGTGSAYIALLDHTSTSSFNDDLTAGDWFLLAAGGASVLPVVSAGSQGKSLVIGNDNATLFWINGTGSTNILYVAPNGNDNNPGTSMALPFASIKKAVSVVPSGQKTAILVKSGTYQEAQLPIVVPPTVAIVGDNTRTTIITPASGLASDGITANNQSTMFRLSDGSILNKLTFQGMTGWVTGSTASDISTSTVKGVYCALNPASPIITKSPYILECTAISSGGIGAYVDGSVHSSGNKSMLFHEYTQIHDNGVGIWVDNNGKAETVSVFTYYCYFGYATTNGGQIRSLAGNNSYGTYGTYSSGYSSSETAVTGSIYGSMITLTGAYAGTINPGDTITSSGGATAVVTNAQSNTIYIASITGTFAATQTITATSGGTATIGSIGGQAGFILVLNNLTALPQVGGSIQITGDSSAYIIQAVSGSYTNTSSIITVVLAQQKVNVSTNGTTSTIRYSFSLLRVTGHDFLNIGTGGITTTNYPGIPTQQPVPSQQVIQNLPGRIYYVSTDQAGNFAVGSYFSINQATGAATLNANSFNLSGLTSLRLGSIGAQLGAQINEFSTDGTLGQNSPIKVPTQSAVVTYVNTRIGQIQLLPTHPSGAGAGFLYDTAGTSSWFPADTLFSQNYPRFTTANTTSSAVYSGTQSISLFQAVNSAGGTVTHTLASGSLPSGLTLQTSGLMTGTLNSGGTATFTITAVSNSITVSKSFTWTLTIITPGQQLYGTNVGTGTFSWTAPAGVTSVSAVAVGGGSGGGYSWSYAGGSGGGLGWKNNITVVPGQSYTVRVGRAGGGNNGDNYGGNSYFIDTTTVAGGGASHASFGTSETTIGTRNGYGGGFIGDGGGAGGNATSYQGGAGAGGYTGRGGNQYSDYTPSPADSGGGAGGGYYSSTYGSGGGGGVGLLGKGTTGSGGNYLYNPFQGYNNSYSNGSGGTGGSGGTMGQYGENPYSSTGNYGPTGGTYGGGGGGPGTSWPGGSGGQGGIRIIWGTNRSYPSNAGDV
jgi:hypothetical protein